MSKSQSRSSAVEPDSFYSDSPPLRRMKYPASDDHFGKCPNRNEPSGKDCAWCAKEERNTREE